MIVRSRCREPGFARSLRLLVFAAALVAPAVAAAHHSFAVFDLTRKVTLEGVVKDYQWTNPHMWVQFLVQENGKTVEYSVEGQSPNILARKGWGPASLKPGDRATLLIYPLKTGQPGGSLLGARVVGGAAFGEAPP